MSNNVDRTENNIPWFWLGIAVFLVLVLWSLNFLLLVNVEGRGTFGDMFGTVNALFSGLAFVGLIAAILLQQRELSLQRRDLVLTRSEIAGQNEQLRLQNQTMKQQTFENTFFQLMRSHNDIIASIDLIKGGTVVATGRDCFSAFYARIKAEMVKVDSERKGGNYRLNLEDAYKAFFEKNRGDLSHYFGSLETMLEFVDTSDITNKNFYTKIIRSQLSSQELLVMFYHGQFGIESENLRELVDRYGILRRIPTNLLIDQGKDVGLYSEEAYGQ